MRYIKELGLFKVTHNGRLKKIELPAGYDSISHYLMISGIAPVIVRTGQTILLEEDFELIRGKNHI